MENFPQILSAIIFFQNTLSQKNDLHIFLYIFFLFNFSVAVLEIKSQYVVIEVSTEAVARRCSFKKGILRNFAKFTGKHLRQGPFFNKIAGFCLRP